MAVLREIRIRARQIAPPVLAACMVAYFGYHAVQGDRGFLTWVRLKQDLAQAQISQTRLADEQAQIERRVGLLRSDNLDPDILEEQANAILGYGNENDRIILLPTPRDDTR